MSVLQVQTLQGPTSGTNSNTVLIPSTNKLHAAGLAVQTVLTTSTTYTVTTTVGLWVANTLLDTSFTPKFSDSLILVEVNLQAGFKSNNNTTSTGGAVRIKSGSTVIGGNPTSMLESFYTRASSSTDSPQLFSRLVKTVEDDSGNTGARTYSFETQIYSGTNEVSISGSSPSTMTITEIAQ